jgi:hypothetical protein
MWLVGGNLPPLDCLAQEQPSSFSVVGRLVDPEPTLLSSRELRLDKLSYSHSERFEEGLGNGEDQRQFSHSLSIRMNRPDSARGTSAVTVQVARARARFRASRGSESGMDLTWRPGPAAHREAETRPMLGKRDCRMRWGEWAHLGSNQGPLACEASALPLSYAPGNNKDRGTGEGSLGLLPPGSDPVRNLTAPRAAK